MKPTSSQESRQSGKALGYILLWILGIPLPILVIVALFRGCS